MTCPHCRENILYKERSGQKCSKCKREFAFEPKTHLFGLHDVRFRKAVAKLSEDGKLYFTAGQLLHFLSRKKIKNNFTTIRGLLIFVAIVMIIAIIVSSFVIKSATLFFLFFSIEVISVAVLSIFWKREGTLTLPQNMAAFESGVLERWEWIYKQSPPNLIAGHLLPQNLPAANVRGILVCPETEILACLAANGTAERLGLLLFNPRLPTDKLDSVRQRQDLPIFVLHDASPEGCLFKDEFVNTHLAGNRSRQIDDIGLRPQTAIKSNLMRLRTQTRNDFPPSLGDLTPEEIAWLKNGNYTPLLALRPAQLIKFVTVAVTKRLQKSAKISDQNFAKNKQKEAQAVGFMTWVGK